MNIKLLFVGTSSIITIVTVIATLGVAQDLITGMTQSIIGTTEESSIAVTYCTKNSDCKQDPSDCTKCVNVLKGGFTLISKCSNQPINCGCVEGQCSVI